MFQIRLFEPGDEAAMITLFQRSIREVASLHYTPDQIKVWAPDEIDVEAWTKRCQSRPTWLVWSGDQLAGFVDLEADGHLDLLYVSPDFQRAGVAKLLYQQVEKQAVLNGNSKIYVEASLSARGFFERQGFYVIEQQEVERGGQLLTNFRMEKML
ncbi:GNAT family N-acetyltransferase [Terasakiella sp. A23]|uniref:GNAT family N-acetyltransferase n=1 Tax=Terasakiella sp. FCG-A23 TaxID=3080561 RepID=UPI002952D7E4|nr:GNAT family N-acetyltransferase [Terasakiella sp. A23]MDV7339838.1 GNAT family N-acetyltransferase [Terasakiella sp. A23]